MQRTTIYTRNYMCNTVEERRNGRHGLSSAAGWEPKYTHDIYIYYMFPRLDLYYSDPAQHNVMAVIGSR